MKKLLHGLIISNIIKLTQLFVNTTFIFTTLLLLSSKLQSQVSIGSSIPANSGALLDLKQESATGKNSSKGLSLPRVNLKATTSPIIGISTTSSENTDFTGKESEHTGLLVFNLTNTINTESDPVKQLCEGLYVWNGKRWDRLSPPCSSDLTLDCPVKKDIIANQVYNEELNITYTYTGSTSLVLAANTIIGNNNGIIISTPAYSQTITALSSGNLKIIFTTNGIPETVSNYSVPVTFTFNGDKQKACSVEGSVNKTDLCLRQGQAKFVNRVVNTNGNSITIGITVKIGGIGNIVLNPPVPSVIGTYTAGAYTLTATLVYTPPGGIKQDGNWYTLIYEAKMQGTGMTPGYYHIPVTIPGFGGNCEFPIVVVAKAGTGKLEFSGTNPYKTISKPVGATIDEVITFPYSNTTSYTVTIKDGEMVGGSGGNDSSVNPLGRYDNYVFAYAEGDQTLPPGSGNMSVRIKGAMPPKGITVTGDDAYNIIIPVFDQRYASGSVYYNKQVRIALIPQ